MSNPDPRTSKQQRVVRIFVSSTFCDMFAEREELVKFTFPELHKRCRERGVEFVDVDLRWGITDEQKSEMQVLPICLAEIERCRPYFISLLGERYGWLPEEIHEELTEVHPWLMEHKEKSITELEIIHGVLNNPEMEKLSFFYFRHLDTSNQIEEELLKNADYQSEPQISHTRLKLLKEKICAHEKTYPVPVRKDFPDAKTLGKLVLEDLWNAIDKKFPKEEVPTSLERERMDHEVFAEARRKVYIGRDECFKRLDEHIERDDPPLVILGESGSGKSALIANWIERYRQNNPDEFIITQFIGSTPDSTDYVRIIRRVMEEIKERYEPGGPSFSSLTEEGIKGGEEISGEIPAAPEKVVEAFPLWLAKASARGKLILILDALNQLEDRDNAPDLSWLPAYFPPDVRVILSTLPGRSLKALKRRNLSTLDVEPIGKNERKKFIENYLEQYRKKLTVAQAEHVASAEQTSNPLYLKTLLEELRIFGIHHKLDNRIRHYLKADTIDDLFELVLERVEEVYEQEKEGLVRDVMSLIWVSRRGLSETELLELLNIQPAVWSPLYLALEGHMVSRSGLLTFFHDFLRKAVEERYIKSAEIKHENHLRLADYFDRRDLDDRKIDELPWQLCEAEDLERLKDCVAGMDMFQELNTEDKQYELMAYWLTIGERFDMVQAYNDMLTRYERTSPPQDELSYRLNEVAYFLHLNARYEGAQPLYRRAFKVYEKALGSDHADTALSLNNLAGLLHDKGDYKGAEPLYRRALEIREKLLGKEHTDTAQSLNNLAGLLYSKGDYGGAEPLYRRALEISEKVLGREHSSTAQSLNNLAGLLYSKGDYKGAEPLYRRALEIREKVLGREHPSTAYSLNNLAALLRSKGDYGGAEPLYRRALEISEKVLGRDHPDTALSLSNLAGLLESKGDYEGAEPLYSRALVIREKVLGKEHPDTAISLNDLAALLRSKGDYDGAEPLSRRALEISEKVLGREHPDTSTSLNNLAELLRSKGDYEGAEPLSRRALEISEKVLGKEHPDTAKSLNNLALLLESKGDYEDAVSLYRRALEIYEKVLGREHPDTAQILNNLAELLRSQGDYEGAEPLYRWALEIREKVLGREHPDTSTSLNNLAALLRSKGDYEGAEPLYRQALEIREKVLGREHLSSAYSLNNLAGLLYSKGEYEGAENLLQRALRIFESKLGKEHPYTVQTRDNLMKLNG